MRLGQPALELLPHALGHEVVGLAGAHHFAHQLHRLLGDAKAEARGKARHAQDAHRILGERRAYVPQELVFEVCLAVKRVDERAALGVLRHGVDGEVAPAKIVLQGHVGRGMEGEPLVAAAAFALGARKRVLLMRFRVEENGKVLADRLEAPGDHLLGRRADDYVVLVLQRQAEQLIAHRAADYIRLHSYMSNWGIDSLSRSAAAIHSCNAGSASIAS